MEEKPKGMERSIKSSQNESSIFSSSKTDSIYTNSFHNRQNVYPVHGTPPLKRTFMNESSDSDDSDDFFEENRDDGDERYVKPEWTFPYKTTWRSDDSQYFEKLKNHYSIKNIVSQLKRSTND